MRTARPALVLATALLLAPVAGRAANHGGFDLAVLVDGAPRPEYPANGTIYVEALRGREYTLRITNPLPIRVAVALSVDGLNTIDARRTGATAAAKWVLGPYETVEISGWQTNGSEARRFFFTGERSSYGAWLGETDNLGVIEAAFFRERCRPLLVPRPRELTRDEARGESGLPPPAPLGAGSAAGEAQQKAEAAPSLSDDYAATGIGDRVQHQVQWVALELERTAAAVVRLRYEFRPELARLGVLPLLRPTPLERREHASGFSGGYCPDPPAVDP